MDETSEVTQDKAAQEEVSSSRTKLEPLRKFKKIEPLEGDLHIEPLREKPLQDKILPDGLLKLFCEMQEGQWMIKQEKLKFIKS